VPFGLFRKKEREAPAEQPARSVPTAAALSIQHAKDLLRSVEAARVHELALRLAPIKESAVQSLTVIAGLANDMEHEKLKLEDLEQRFKSVAENSKKTVVSSLRREALTELLLPQSANDARKFKEKFEAMMKRFGEVSGSHSKMLNAFMKKQAGKMRAEFEVLTKLLNETRAAISDFEQKREPIVKCSSLLNTASQKASSIKSAESSVLSIESEMQDIENGLHGLKSELDSLRASPEFGQAMSIAQKAGEAARHEEQFHAELVDLFSHVSRAFTKYSYGLTKVTEARLQVMSDEPWNMLRESDVSPYSSLLLEIRKSIDSGKIQLKDSDRIVHHLDVILGSIPELQGRARAIKSERDSLRGNDTGLFSKVRELEERVFQHEEELIKGMQNVEQQKRQIIEKGNELDVQLKEASTILVELTGQKYSLEY
jgi:hypothetical protein